VDEKRSKFRVGYGKPPHETRFKPGQSGNPGGRPKNKTITLVDAFARELNASIAVTEGGKSKKMTKLVAIAKQQTNKALKGDHKATELVMKIVEPREIDTKENLSPVVAAMRAIYARHQTANQNVTNDTFSSGSNDNLVNDCGEQQ
jgi:hypothetical protein